MNHTNLAIEKRYAERLNPKPTLLKTQGKIQPGTGRIFAFAKRYSRYITTEIIGEELLRNIILATICIFFVMLIFLTDFVASILVLTTILMTLINVAGFMHFLGLTIDIVTAILLTVSF